MNKPAAIYARVSSDRQKENHTIASQTAALIEYAQKNGYSVPPEWVFQDEGYSGAILVRPRLEALRDLAAEGQIAAALIYSPDRLSREYAYQVLLSEELARCGVEIVFLKSPASGSPEDQLVVQFQGMIAEYERAQIAERSRRGKRHKAREGVVNILSGAPYGYRYMKKTDTSAAYYHVLESEAGVVRMVFQMYAKEHLSINAIARLLNTRGIATRTGKTRWERSTVWGILRNPAYQGRACFGKTELRPRQRITRPLRQRNGVAPRDSANHERPRSEWIEVSVPALVSEEIFALAHEQLTKNKHHSPRRSNQHYCKACWYASNVATRCIDVLHAHRNGGCIIIGVWARTPTAISKAHCARIDRSGKITSMNLSGTRSFFCWRMRRCCKRKSIAEKRQHEMEILDGSVTKYCAVNKRVWEILSSD